jgi:hypothetical protein
MPRLSPHPITLLLLGALLLMLCILPSASGAPTPHGSPARAPSSPDPLTCRGYLEERLFLESQIWWKRASGKSGTDFGHVHTGMCFPYLQTLSGKFVVHVVTKLHDNPGTFNDIIFQARNEAYSSRPLQLRPHIVVRKKCPLADCTFVTRAVIDTRVLPVDGLWQFRIRSRVTEPDSRVAMPSNAFPVYVQNGRPRRDGPAWTQGRGWYGRPLGYNDAYFMGIIPESPVAGVWEPSVRTNRVNAAEKSKMTRTLVTIDPDFHAVPAYRGLVVQEVNGEFYGRVSIDTRQLANGPHRLVIIGSSWNIGGRGSTLSGVLAIPFEVSN